MSGCSLISLPLSSTALLFPPAAGRLWEQGQQMFCESGGGDAGVHADHHVVMSSSYR